MHWTVVAPFIREQSDSQWLTPFVPGQRHQFRCVPRQGSTINWHEAALPVTGREEWLRLWNQSQEAVKAKQGGIITVFPQLAATVGLRMAKLGFWWNPTQSMT